MRLGYRHTLLSAIVTAACTLAIAHNASADDPVFSVHKNGTAQTVVADTATLLTWATEVIDTNTNFATNRFTPTVAGNYLIVLSAQCAQPGACVPSIYKNGALYAGSRITNQSFADQAPQATAIVAMNGSTDYVEAFATSSGTSIGGVATQTYFSGTVLGGSGSGGGISNGMVSGWPDAIRCNDDTNVHSLTFILAFQYPGTETVYRYIQNPTGSDFRIAFNTSGIYQAGNSVLSGYATDCARDLSVLIAAGKTFNFIGGASAAAAGAAGQVQFYSGGNLAADAGLTWDNTNKRLGIGTSSPTTALDVNGTIKATTYSGLASNFTRITAIISAPTASAWGYSSYTSCPANYTLINYGLTSVFSSGSFPGAGVSYHDCNVSGNSVRAAHFTQVTNVNFYTSCFGLCVRN